MSYAAAIDQLSAMAPELHTQPGQQRRKFSLTEIGALLAALGNPHHRFRSVLIAGTNGKGSTAATLASILRESGLRSGLYTSPHLVRPNERIRLNGIEISDDAFASLYFRVHDAGQQLVSDHTLAQLPSFFETLTAMAFLYFAEEKADIAVLEVGMGGRLDATNIVDPLLSIVTDISLDHTEWLGPTIAAIAREKAGILRANGTLITLPQHPEANQVLGEVATELGTRAVSAVPYMPQTDRTRGTSDRSGIDRADRFVTGRDFSRANVIAEERRALAPAGRSYQVEVLGSAITVDSPLHGDHQHRNIALAIAAAVELATHHNFPITPASIEHGIRTTQWPGRLEVFTTQACVTGMGALGLASETWEGIKVEHGPTQAVLDVAHNPAGAWALRAALRSEFGLDPPDEKADVLIFGCLRDKPLAEMAQILFPLFHEIIFAPIYSPRATPMADLLAAAEAVGVTARAASSVEEALIWAENSISARPENSPANTSVPPALVSGHDFSRAGLTAEVGGASAPATTKKLVVVCGSVYLVGEIRPILLARAQALQAQAIPQPIR
jgi:dihydrofolate synthase/folylpolyglutamate synthase